MYKMIMTDLNTNTDYNLICEWENYTEETVFNKDYSYSEQIVSDSRLIKRATGFKSIPLSFKTNTHLSKDLDLKGFKHAIRRKDSNLLLKINKDGIEYMVFVSLVSDNIDQIRALPVEEISIKFATNTNFIVEKKFDYITSGGQEIDTGGFPYTFPRKLGGNIGSTYGNGKLIIGDIGGDTDAYLRVEIFGQSISPAFSINSNKENTRNSYESSDMFVSLSQSLVINSQPNIASITKNGVNVSQNRIIKNNNSYCTIPFDNPNNYIEFYNVKSAVVKIYEQYYNI